MPYLQKAKAWGIRLLRSGGKVHQRNGVLKGQWAMLNWRALICACGLLVAVLAPLADGRGGFLRAVRVRKGNGLSYRAHHCAGASCFTPFSHPGALVCPHGHKNGSGPAARAPHFVLPLPQFGAPVVAILPPRCLAIP